MPPADVADDAGRDAVREAPADAGAQDDATFVSDPGYAGVTAGALVEMAEAAGRDEKLGYLFVADGERRLPAVSWTGTGGTPVLPGRDQQQ